MRHLLIPALCALAFAPTASADKFYFGPEPETAVEGAAPNYIEGVLLREEGDMYVIRVEGGEMTIAKSLVTKIERDELTAEALTQREGDKQAQLAEANAQRRQMLQPARVAHMERIREVRAAEASARREAQVVEAEAPAVGGGFAYDPVLDVVNWQYGTAIQNELGSTLRRLAQREARDLRGRLRDLLRRR